MASRGASPEDQVLSGGGHWNAGDYDPAVAIIASWTDGGAGDTWAIQLSNQGPVSHTFNPMGFCLPE